MLFSSNTMFADDCLMTAIKSLIRCSNGAPGELIPLLCSQFMIVFCMEDVRTISYALALGLTADDPGNVGVTSANAMAFSDDPLLFQAVAAISK